MKRLLKLGLALGMTMAVAFIGCKHETVETEPMSYTVTISTGVTNGTVTSDRQTAHKDETVTLTIAANEGYEFDSISVKDASNNAVETTVVTAGTTYTFVMPESNVTVSATFVPTSYTIAISTNITNGTVTADKQTAHEDETVTLTLAASEGYKLNSVSVKDAFNHAIGTTAVTAGTTYTFVMPESNVTVSATFILEGINGSGVFIDGRNISIRSNLWASDHEVTQAEYQEIMGTNPSYIQYSSAEGETQENRPVENVSWYDCLVYCNKRSIAEELTPCYTIGGKTDPDEWGEVPTESDPTWNAATCDFDANGYRLPTEAEWEYLARGGNKTNSVQTEYSGSDTIGDVAWYYANSGSMTHEVKKKAPNDLGLYDMTGNVLEWCWDWSGSLITVDTPSVGVSSGYGRVIRGGCWGDYPEYCCVAFRSYYGEPYSGDEYKGFRVVRSAN